MYISIETFSNVIIQIRKISVDMIVKFVVTKPFILTIHNVVENQCYCKYQKGTFTLQDLTIRTIRQNVRKYIMCYIVICSQNINGSTYTTLKLPHF